MSIADRFPTFAPPHPADAFQKPRRAELIEAEAEAERKPGQIDLHRLFQPVEGIVKNSLASSPPPEGKLPFLISEVGAPSTKGWGGPTRCMRLITFWQGFAIVREVGGTNEAKAIHAELERFLLGVEK